MPVVVDWGVGEKDVDWFSGANGRAHAVGEGWFSGEEELDTSAAVFGDIVPR